MPNEPTPESEALKKVFGPMLEFHVQDGKAMEVENLVLEICERMHCPSNMVCTECPLCTGVQLVRALNKLSKGEQR